MHIQLDAMSVLDQLVGVVEAMLQHIREEEGMVRAWVVAPGVVRRGKPWGGGL